MAKTNLLLRKKVLREIQRVSKKDRHLLMNISV